MIVRGLDSDDNGRPDRVHVQYRLPADRSGKVAAVLEASPYLSGGNEEVRNHDVDVPLHVPQAAAGSGIHSPYERSCDPTDTPTSTPSPSAPVPPADAPPQGP